ncbi:MAG: recombinase family protein [Bulleidia sp.]
MRTAAYCRVSTLAEEQELSYETQQAYYRVLFENDDSRLLIGVYGDHGVSGVQAVKRHGFMDLIEDCRLGRIDEIHTKSISRFARNFSECLTYIRELRELGVTVYFEKEGMTTEDENMEIILTLMSIVAQEESNSISQSITWAVEKRNRDGDPIRRAVYGYQRDQQAVNGVHQWHIVPEQAKRVELVYRYYLEGKQYARIVKAIQEYEAEHGTKGNGQHVA